MKSAYLRAYPKAKNYEASWTIRLNKLLERAVGPSEAIYYGFNWAHTEEGTSVWHERCSQYIHKTWDMVLCPAAPKYQEPNSEVIGELCKTERFSEVARINYDIHWSDDDLAKDWKKINKVLEDKGIKYDSYDFDVEKHQIILYKCVSEYSIA